MRMFSAGVTSHKYAPSCWRIPDMGVDLPSTFETSLARKSIALVARFGRRGADTRLGSISAHLCSRSVVMVIVFWVVSYCHHMLRFWE